MSLRRFSIMLSLLFTFTVSAPAAADELVAREQIMSEVAQLFRSEQFAALEVMAYSYRANKSRTSSGIWKLEIFYRGLSRVFDWNNSAEDYWAECERLSDAWLAAYPKSPTAQLARVALLTNRAWATRGTGYANTVKSEDWAPFFAIVDEAHDYLVKTKTTASSDPHWYTSMAEVATFQGWPAEDFAALIDEALDREPFYYNTYFMALNRYLPKWGGSAEAVERFAREAMERTSAVDGRGMYARIYWNAAYSHYKDNLFAGSDVDWAEMKRGFDDVLARYPDSWNLNQYGRFACMAGDSAKILELIDRIGEQQIEEAWPMAYMDACRAWAEQHPDSPGG